MIMEEKRKKKKVRKKERKKERKKDTETKRETCRKGKKERINLTMEMRRYKSGPSEAPPPTPTF